MKKAIFVPVILFLVVVGVVSVSGCIEKPTTMEQTEKPEKGIEQKPAIEKETLSESNYCPVSDLGEFKSCGEACLEFIGLDECKQWCVQNKEKCEVKVGEPVAGSLDYWKIFQGIGPWKKEYISEIKEVSELNGNIFNIYKYFQHILQCTCF